MDRSRSEYTGPDTRESRQLLLRPAPGTFSDISPSKPMPEIESVIPTVSAWRNTDEALNWFIKLRKVLKNYLPIQRNR